MGAWSSAGRRYNWSALGLFDRAVASVLPAVPRSVVQRVSAPYIAGPTLDDARRTVVVAEREGKRATIDVLGEEIHSAAEAQAIAAAYGDVFAAIARRRPRRERLGQAHRPRAEARPRPLPLAARGPRPRRGRARLLRPDRHGGRVLRGRHARALPRAPRRRARQRGDRAAVVSQAHAHGHRGAARPPARACGCARGSTSSRPRSRSRTPRSCGARSSRAWRRCSTAAPGSRSRPTTSTCSASRSRGWRRCRRRRTSSRCCSGCGRPGRASSSRPATRLRVYVPFGQRWYEYSLRRLQENPQMAGVIAKATLGRMVGRDVGRVACRPPLRRQAEAAVDDQCLAAHHLRVGRAEERDGRRPCPRV